MRGDFKLVREDIDGGPDRNQHPAVLELTGEWVGSLDEIRGGSNCHAHDRSCFGDYECQRPGKRPDKEPSLLAPSPPKETASRA